MCYIVDLLGIQVSNVLIVTTALRFSLSYSKRKQFATCFSGPSERTGSWFGVTRGTTEFF